MTSVFSPRSPVSSPTDSQSCINSSQDLIQPSGLLNTDLSEQYCLTDNIKLISQESSSSLTVDLSRDIQTCDYSSVTCVTHDSVEPCGSVRAIRDLVQDLLSPETGDYDLFVPIYSSSPTVDLSRDLLTRDYSTVPDVTRDFGEFCSSMRDTRDIIHDVFVSETCDHDFFVPVLACSSSFTDANVECDTSSSLALVRDDPAYGVFLHDTVYALGAFNHQVCRLPVPSRLNIPLWRTLLANYDDYIVCDYLEFGWPVGYVRDSLPVTQQRKHHGAVLFPGAIDKYLQTERSYGAVLGPFASNPFASDVVLSPLNSVPKGEFERRIIVDLSWPIGSSVNDGIPSKQYLGEDFNLVYPTVDDVAARILALGPGCLLFKRDLKRAYRQFPVDPGDYHLLGYSWRNQMFFDTVLPMGLRSAAMACQRVTNAVRYMCASHGHDILNYLDDFTGVAHPDLALASYNFLGELLRNLHLEESEQKAEPPSTCMTILGVRFDTVSMTMSVTKERLLELSALLSEWATFHVASKAQLQSLVGKLVFVSKCVKQSRIFLSRILELLRTLSSSDSRSKVRLSDDFHRDLAWWRRFLPQYNGVSYLYSTPWSAPDAVFSTDACLSGCGGISDHEFFHCEFPPSVMSRGLDINGLELLTVVIACKLWGHRWSRLRILVYCDNQATVAVINSHKSRNSFLNDCLRELWLLAAIHDFELRAVHLEGQSNRAADLLSRWHLSSSTARAFHKQFGGQVRVERLVPPRYFTFDNQFLDYLSL